MIYRTEDFGYKRLTEACTWLKKGRWINGSPLNWRDEKEGLREVARAKGVKRE